MRTALRNALVAGGVLPVLLAATACGTEDPADTPRAEPAASSPSASGTAVVGFDFDELGALEQAGVLGTGALPLTNTAPQPVTVRVATVAGGSLRAERGREGGYAARFPAYSSGDPRRVVVMTFAAGNDDPLGPGSADFSFGAEFTLDPLSEEDGLDDGNNLVQRGLSADPAQYKIQIDHGRASCRIAGDDGEVLVKSQQTIEPETWYRVSCTRSGDDVTLELRSFDGSAGERTVGSGATGAIRLPSTTPLVMGGKATSEGEAVKGNSDQFNGAIDNVFLTRDP